MKEGKSKPLVAVDGKVIYLAGLCKAEPHSGYVTGPRQGIALIAVTAHASLPAEGIVGEEECACVPPLLGSELTDT